MKNNKTIIQLGLLATVLLAFSISLDAQPSQKSKDQVLQSAPWMDEETQSKLAFIYDWDKIRIQKNDTIATTLQLNEDLTTMENKKNNFSQCQKWLQKQFRYDTIVLRRLQEGNGDSVLKALYLCHQAENVLNHRYNKQEVEEAKRMIAYAKNYVQEVAEDIEYRLERYSTTTANLKDALTRANAIRPEVDPTRADSRKNYYTKEFFEELEKYIYPVILSPQEYPYLYEILSKAITEKRKDPSTDIKGLIDQL